MNLNRRPAGADAAASGARVVRVETDRLRDAFAAVVANLSTPSPAGGDTVDIIPADELAALHAELTAAEDAAPIDYRRATREAARADNPREYAADLLAAASHEHHAPEVVAGLVPEAAREYRRDTLAALTIEQLREQARRAVAARDREALAALAAAAGAARTRYAGLFDPDPRRFGRPAARFAALAQMLVAAAVFLRALAVLADLSEDRRAPVWALALDTPEHCPPPASLLTRTLTAAPAAPPRAAVAARA